MTSRPRRAATVVEHLTYAEREAAGRAARAEVPRRGHAVWEPPADRFDPVALLEAQATTRVPELVPLRYGRMLVSAFTFYRGAAEIMAADLATQPHTGLRTQLCGDAHLSNFGAFAAPDRELVFDVNDFDETLPGPFEWDVKRLVTSFEIAGRDRGFTADQRVAVNRAAGRAYRETVREFAQLGVLDQWYARIRIQDIIEQLGGQGTAEQRRRAQKNLAKARGKTSLKALAKLTETVDGELRIRSDPPRVVPMRELAGPELYPQVERRVRTALRAYRRTLPHDRRKLLERFRLVDAARKVVGVGSVGTRAWILLLVGRDDQDPLFLQVKEAEASVLESSLGESEFAAHGQRVVEGQRLMQAASDIMLGWFKTKGFDGVDRHYYVRQLWDAKGSALVELMEPNVLELYATLCGSTLARAHARAGDSVALASYLGRSDTFDRAMAAFAVAYADQNERDYATMQAAVKAGRIPVEIEPDR